MNSTQIATEIQLRFKSIERYTAKLEVHFNKDNLFFFREEVKSLRAFLDLLHCEPSVEGDLKIRKRLKSFYGYTGIIQSLLIHLQYVLQKYQDETLIKNSPYIAALENEMNQWTKSAMDVLRDGRDFEDEESRILNAVPRKLSNKAINKYLDEKSGELKTLLNGNWESEDDFHALRSIVKNLIYLWRYVGDSAKQILPSVLVFPGKLKSLDSLLIAHQQYYVQLHYLQPSYMDLATEAVEQSLLQSAFAELTAEHESVQQQILESLSLHRNELQVCSFCEGM